MHRQSQKRLLNNDTSSTCLHNMVNFGLLTADMLGSLGHPCKFQRLSRLGSVTARYFTSGRQRNFAALNRRRHLCSAGRPSRWALAHILVKLCSSRSNKLSLYRPKCTLLHKKRGSQLMSITLSKLNRFSKFFDFEIPRQICSKAMVQTFHQTLVALLHYLMKY